MGVPGRYLYLALSILAGTMLHRQEATPSPTTTPFSSHISTGGNLDDNHQQNHERGAHQRNHIAPLTGGSSSPAESSSTASHYAITPAAPDYNTHNYHAVNGELRPSTAADVLTTRRSSSSTPDEGASRVNDLRRLLQDPVTPGQTERPEHDLSTTTSTTSPPTSSSSLSPSGTIGNIPLRTITDDSYSDSYSATTSATTTSDVSSTHLTPDSQTILSTLSQKELHTLPDNEKELLPGSKEQRDLIYHEAVTPLVGLTTAPDRTTKSIKSTAAANTLTKLGGEANVGVIEGPTSSPEGGSNSKHYGSEVESTTTQCPNEITKATEAKLLAAELLAEQFEPVGETHSGPSPSSSVFSPGEGSGGTSASVSSPASRELDTQTVLPHREPVIKWDSTEQDFVSEEKTTGLPIATTAAGVAPLVTNPRRAGGAFSALYPASSSFTEEDLATLSSLTTKGSGSNEDSSTLHTSVTPEGPAQVPDKSGYKIINKYSLNEVPDVDMMEMPLWSDASEETEIGDTSTTGDRVGPLSPDSFNMASTSAYPILNGEPSTAVPDPMPFTHWVSEREADGAKLFSEIKKVVAERKRNIRRLNDVMGDMPLGLGGGQRSGGRLQTEVPAEVVQTTTASTTSSSSPSPAVTSTMPVTLVPEVVPEPPDVTSSTNVTNTSFQDVTSETSPHRPKKKTLHVGGLFELTGAQSNGRSDLDAAQMAIDHVNEKDIINGYTLKLVPNDTKCDPGYGADAFYDLVYRKPTMMMLIGSSCSEVTKTLAQIVPYWNLVQISYAATSPALSKREKYPNFYRLAAADSSHNAARKTFIQRFGWDTVAILHQDLETFSLAVNDMHATFNKVNITVKATLTFRGLGADLRVKLLELNRTDARIIIGSFQEDAARQVFCEAFHLGMYGPRYVWMLVGWYTEQWWTQSGQTTCTPSQLAMVIDGYFSVDTLNSIIGNRTSRSGLTTRQFLEEYERRNLTKPRSSYAAVTYDTVWTVALTLRRTMQRWRIPPGGPTLDAFNYRTGYPMFREFFKVLGSLDFMGVSGPVSFDGPDRRGISVLGQNQGGLMKRIAIFYPENNTLDFKCLGCKPIIWRGGKVPADKYTIVTRREHIEPGAFFTVCAGGSVGILVASFFLGFNLYHRKLKYIKLSSPKLNNVAVIGCIHVYLAVILLGFDDATLDVTYFPVMCTVRAFLMAAGFSLAFGAMFTKTYRVHQIFTRAHSGLVKSKLLKDTQLLIIVVALLVVDVFIIGLWVSLDPMHRSVTNFTSVPSEEDTDLLYIPQLAKCDSFHLDKWLGAFYAYKGLLLLFGVYMAWETRHVKIPVLNDSQYIGMNIYNVVLMSVTVVALSSILTDRPTLSYAVVSALIILSTTGLLGLLFLPKIYAIVKHNGSPIITSAGLTVEANTRRFAVDEKKELQYRAEVQNRVYKRELVELEQEMLRLERLLELPGQQYNHVGEDLLYLLPDAPPAHNTPSHMRRRQADLVRCDSSTFITDAADVCSDLPEINLSCLDSDEKRKLEKKDSGFHTMSFKNSNFMTAEEENPRVGRGGSGNGEERLSGVSGVSGSGVDLHSTSSPEMEPFMHGARPPGPDTHASVDGGALYTPLRRQSSTDGDIDERQSLLVGEAALDEDMLAAVDPHVRSATILINKPGIRSHSDHALGRAAAAAAGGRHQPHEHYELRDMSRSTAALSQLQRQRGNNSSAAQPPGGDNNKPPPWTSNPSGGGGVVGGAGTEKQSKHLFKGKRAKTTDALVKSADAPYGMNSQAPSAGAAGKPTASTSQQQRTLTEGERRRKIQVLQRELARIQKELKSLGELEIEVSYV